MKHASLNHVYRLVWSALAGAYVAVAEHRNSRRKGSGAAAVLTVSALLGAASVAHADGNVLPTAGRVTVGSGSIGQNGSTMTVTQGSDRLVIDWNSFDIGAANGVRFAQPGTGSIALNRVTGGTASSILGSLTANGQVWLVNPSGVVFGTSARVDVGGLVASTLSLSDSDFLAGRNRFTGGTGAGTVVNQGHISATGGVVALLGPQVRNVGTITTTGGSTVLAAGDRVSLDFNGDGLVSVNIDRSVVDALVENSGRISADGGLVVLSARSANKALDSVVNNTGVIEAKGLIARNGRILLDGDAEQGGTHVSGTLDVSSAIGPGGAITVTGHDIVLDRGATLDASGANGGGSIRVGGGFKGKDATVANATTVSADASVTARADATGNGDGGNIVFWSDDATRLAGNLSVRGGAAGGDGGSIEVSGKQDLRYSGRADGRAPLGRTGDLLLDPATLTISGGGTGTGVLTGTTVFEKDLEAQNANVLLQATGVVTVGNLALNGGDGTISMANNISLRVEGGTGGSGNINFTSSTNTIEVFGTGSLMFVAGATGTGNIVGVPNLIAHGAGINPVTLPTHVVTSVGSGTPGNASITLFGADGVTVGGSVTTNGGYVRVWADSDNAGGGGYSMTAPVTTNGGNFYVSAGTGNIDLNGAMTLGSGRILFKADGAYTSGTKTLGALLSASGAVDVNTPFVMNAGAGILTDGVITFSNTVNLNTGAGALRLRASAIDFTAATLSNLSTASLILEPANPATSMVLGDANGFASATTLAKLPGVRNLTIGRTDGTGSASVASNFSFAATGILEIVNRNIAITGGTLTNTAGNVTLTGDNVNISQQVTSNAGAGAVTIRQLTAANPINLGSGLPNSVIGQVNAATLVIGRSDGGDVTFDSNIATTASTVHLLSGGQVIGTAGGVSAANLAINAGAGATLTAPVFNFTKLALAVGGPTTINQTQSGFVIAAVDGVTGLAINAGTNANVTLSSPGVISATGALALNANTSLLTLNATAVDLSSATVTGATNASFAMQPLNASDSLAIGGTSGFATSATLAKLTNSKNVRVGRSDGSGLSTVSAPVSLAASGTLELVNGQVALAGSVANSGGALKLTALAGNLTLNANATAAGQLTLSATGSSVGGTGTLSAPSLLVNAPSAAVALNAAANNVGTIAGHAGSLSFVDAASLVVGTVGGVNGVTSAGNLTLRTTGATADLTLNQAVSGSAAGDAVVLAAGRNFINNGGASAIGAAGGGRWLVYSGSPLNDTRGGLAYGFKQYNAAYGATVLGSGNGFVYRAAPTVTLGLAGGVSKVYDGNTVATLTSANYTVAGAIDGDAVTFASTGATYATKGVGNGKSVSASGLSLTGVSNGAATVYGYQLAGTTATGNIGQVTPATLTVGAASVADKVYDATRVASVNGVALTGVIGSDAIGTTATGAFADKNVGNGKAVTVSGVTLTGADAGNYVLSSTSANGTASITPATLTVGASTIADKVYDATTVASVNGVALTGVIGGDAIGTTATGAFANKNVANGKAVTVSGVALTGADAGNYVLSSTNSNGTASITPAILSVGASTIADKVYDATTVASVSGIASTGAIGGDDVGLSGTGAFANKNVGTGKAVAVSGVSLSGADAGNYVLSSTSSNGTASITPATLIVGGSTIADKVYDATTVASVNGVALTGVIGGDAIGTSATGAFADKNVGNGKAVAVSGVSLSGADAGNYVLSSTSSNGTASITPATLIVGGSTIADKVYDATTVASISGVALTGVIGGDDIGTSGTGAFANKNVGNGKAVTVSGVALTGADAANYVLDTTSSTGSANITPALLTVGAASIADKVYDATTAAAVSGVSVNGVIGNEMVGVTATGAFVDRNVGAGKAVVVSNVTLSGADAGNYALNTTGALGTASITPATLTLTGASVADRAYDTTTVAALGNVTVGGRLGSDAVQATGDGAFADAHAGTAKAVSLTSLTLTGSDAGNYVFDTSGVRPTGTITPALLTVGAATVADKVYDGGTGATVGVIALGGVFSGDGLGTTASGAFADKNVAGGKAVSVSGIALSGASASDYRLAATTTGGSANITPALLTVGAASIADKVYDATTAAAVSGVSVNGVIGNEMVGVTATGAFVDRNVGAGKAVVVSNVTLSGADAGNYALNTTGALGTASITPATLTLTGASVADRAYDTTTVAALGNVTVGGRLGSDAVQATGDGAFADAHAGTAKAVSLTSLTLTGSDAGNYVFDTSGVRPTGTITPALLTVGAATVADKVYDGGTGAVVGPIALAGIFGGDAVGTVAGGAFADKNVANGKLANVTGIALTGTSAGDYRLDRTTSGGTASITPATLTVGAATVADKVYDATTAATVGGIVLGGVLGGDAVAASGTGGHFADKNVGSGKAVTIGAVGLSGADAGNYRLDTTGTVGTASITPATLTATGAAVADKTYDGSTGATVGAIDLSGVLGADRVAAGASGRFADPDIGIGKPVAVSAITLGGADAGNYRLASSTMMGQASIEPAASLPLIGTLAALTSPQAGSNGTAGRSSASVPDGTEIATTLADADATRATSGLVPADSGAATRSPSGGTTSITTDVAGLDRSDGRVGSGSGSVAMVEVSDTVLTSGDRVSIALDRSGPADPVSTSLPVYSMAPGVATQREGQFVVVDRGASLSMTPDGDEHLAIPSVTQRVTGSAEATVPVEANRWVAMRVDFLADHTLVATVASPASRDEITTLATFGLIVAKTGLSIAVDDIRAVVLRFGTTAPTTAPKSDDERRETT